MNITEASVKKLSPKDRQYLAWDSKMPGFGILISPGGAKTFIAQGNVNGRSIRLSLGRVGVLSAERAKSKARKVLDQMYDGIDPREKERQRIAESITFQEAWELAGKTMRSKHRAARTITDYEKLFDRYLSDWKPRALRDIGTDRRGVREAHERITKKHGPVAANQTLSALRSVYNRALKEHPDLPPNPVGNVDFNPQEPRKRAIPEDKLALWAKRVRERLTSIKRDFYLFLLFTGLRNESARVIRLEDILEDGAIRIHKPKGGEKRAFTLPLSNFLIELLKARMEENKILDEKSPWLFPSETANSGHLEEPKITAREWEKLNKPEEEALPHFSAHSCRHTFQTAAHNAGIAPYDYKLLMNHSLPRSDISARYLTPQTEPLRIAQQKVTDYILARIEPKGGKVVRIGERKRAKA